MQAGDGEPVRRDIGHKVSQPRHRVRVVEVVIIAGGENGDDAAARRINRALIGAARYGAEDLLNLVKLFLRVIYGEVRISGIAAALGEFIGDADAPAIVDDAYAAFAQRIPARFIDRAVVAEDNAVFRARIAVFRADDLRPPRHAVHFAAVTAACRNAADVSTMRSQFAVGINARRAVIFKRIACFYRNVGIGVGADAFGHQVDHFIRAGEFRVLCVNRLIEDPQFYPFAAVAGGIGRVSVNRSQPPFSVELAAAPAGWIARRALLDIAGCPRLAHRSQAHRHRQYA